MIDLKDFLKTLGIPCKSRIFLDNDRHYDFEGDALKGIAELISSDYEVVKWSVQEVVSGQGDLHPRLFIYVENKDKTIYQKN